MPSLFTNEFKPPDHRLARSVSAAISVAAQLAAAFVIVSAATATVPGVARSVAAKPPSVVYLAASHAAVPRPVRVAHEAPAPMLLPEPAMPAPRPIESRRFETHVLPAPARRETRALETESAPPMPPPAPVVTMNAFPTATTSAPTPVPPQRVETAGFDRTSIEPSAMRRGAAAVGSFDAAVTQSAPAANRELNTLVQDSGFTHASPAGAGSAPPARIVRASGFGASNEAAPSTPPRPTAPQATAFDDARVVAATRRNREEAPPRRAVEPVAVIAKPTPAYTEEARRLKIEGEVVLEVEFSASGEVRVIRVVRGLGYGLDETAAAAAAGIQFKPATSDGRPIDYRTTVQIVFRLA